MRRALAGDGGTEPRNQPGDLSTFEELSALHRQVPRSFLERRYEQLLSILHQAQVSVRGMRVLELGGGMSGHGFVLAREADLVVCTDLFKTESSHSEELTALKPLAAARPSMKLVAAAADALPLADSTIDLVYSSFVLEHVRDRQRAVQEMERVLRPGGLAITNVPNVGEPVIRAVIFYLRDLPRYLVKSFLSWTGMAGLLGVSFTTTAAPRPRTRREITVWLRGLTFKPHGEYPSRIDEIRRSTPATWDELFERQGLRVVKSFTIGFEDYLAFGSESRALRLQSFLRPLVDRVGGTRPAIWLGTSYCFVARKEGGKGDRRRTGP